MIAFSICLLSVPQEQLPFSISRISVVGAAGQGTTIKGYQELDLAVFVKGIMHMFGMTSSFSTQRRL